MSIGVISAPAATYIDSSLISDTLLVIHDDCYLISIWDLWLMLSYIY